MWMDLQKYVFGRNCRCRYYVVRYISQLFFVHVELNQQYFFRKILSHSNTHLRQEKEPVASAFQGLQPVQLHALDCQLHTIKIQENIDPQWAGLRFPHCPRLLHLIRF